MSAIDFTIVICSYKATSAFKLCLHQLARYGFKNKDLLIYENSPADFILNRNLLNQYHIKYIDNPGGTHAETMNRALTEVKTKYALLLDSDCFCIKDPRLYVRYATIHKIQLYGEICGDRGGYHIHRRVHPWYCIVDVDFIKKHNIDFVDFERIKSSHSESFIDTKLIGNYKRDHHSFYYDAGSSMFEDVINNDGVCADIGDALPYIHLEGASWRSDSESYKQTYEEQKQWLKMLYTKMGYEEKYLGVFDIHDL